LTYNVHAASTVLACVLTMRSRRNLLDEIDASILRLIRSCTRVNERSPCRLVRLGPPVGTWPSGRRLCDENVTASAICPLTDGRHEGRAHWSDDTGSGDDSMWACHNEREEDRSGSPRESRVTVALRPKPVKNDGSAGKHG